MTEPSSRKRILILSHSDLGRDPRVNRQIRSLRSTYDVVAAGVGHPHVEGVGYIPIEVSRGHGSRVVAGARLLLRRYERAYWGLPWVRSALEAASGLPFDGVIANDVDALPVALRIANGAPVIIDAHEYSPRQFEDRLTFRLLLQGYRTYLCQNYMPLADAALTVSAGIADQYEQDLGVRPTVMWNASEYHEISPPAGAAEGETIRLVHHGVAGRSRRLEEMIRMMRYVDERFELTFMLVPGSPGYLGKLRRRAQGSEKIRFIDPVPMRRIVRTISAFDVGVYLLPPTNFNQLHALPNKFFEFVQARLATAIGPSPEMARLVREHGLGVVAEDFSARSMATALNALTTAEIAELRRNADRAARLLSTNTTAETLLDIVDATLG